MTDQLPLFASRLRLAGGPAVEIIGEGTKPGTLLVKVIEAGSWCGTNWGIGTLPVPHPTKEQVVAA